MVTADRLLKLSLSILFFSFDFLVNRVPSMLGREEEGSTVVLYYHSVKQSQRERFARQMDEVIRWAKPIPVSSCSQYCRQRNVAVTFDDGFTSIVENALPELQKRNIPATIFVPIGLIGGKANWITDARDQDFNEDVLSAGSLKQLDNNELFSIGSHCITHPNLPSLHIEEADREIMQSKKDLETILGREVNSLSFPHGAFSTAHVQSAERAGYKYIFSITPDFSRSSSFVVGRVKADPSDSLLEFRLKILNAYRWLSVASAIKSKFRALKG